MCETAAPKALELPYADLDILGHPAEEHHVAGAGILAELVQGWADRQLEAGKISKEEAERLNKLGVQLEDEQLAQMRKPSRSLNEVAVTLAYALRVSSYILGEESPYGRAGMSLIAMALADTILLREAEAHRRYKAGKKD